MSTDYDELFIGGRWTASTGNRRIEVHSPHDGRLIGHAPEATEQDVDRAVAAARRVMDDSDWPHRPPADRADLMARLAARYLEGIEDMAQLISAQIGAPITFSRTGQAGAGWALFDTYAKLAADHPWEEHRIGAMTGARSLIRREPVGVVAAIAPWNVPQVTILAKLAPALVAGCAVVVKPSPETPLDALLLATWAEEVGFPEGTISVLPADREVAEHLVRHRGVDKVAFTGSVAAGRRIGAICGEQLKRCSLELGGKSAAVVLDDADLARTAKGLKGSSFLNSGQACAAQTRILVPQARHDDFVDALCDVVAGLVVGDPSQEETDIGPMVSSRQQDRIAGYIDIGQQEGARVAVGGPGLPEGLDTGCYVRPTVFVDVDNGMRIAQEEIFGPVLAVIPYRDESDAIRIANDSDFGLGGSVWTGDRDHGVEVAKRIRTGTVGINGYRPDFSAPFGGYKDSGFGREFGPEGLDEFVEIKSISR